MRYFNFRVSLAALLAIFTLGVNGQDKDKYEWPVKLQKDFSKTYPIGSNTISLKNRYGQLAIETWDRNEVKVEAHVSVGAQTNEYANAVLEKISVTDEQKDGVISFMTKADISNNDNNNNGWGNYGGHEIRIDYLVHIPSSAKLYAENSFGPVTIGDHTGESEFLVKYGNLTAGKLANCKQVEVDFGRANIESLNNTVMLFKYSRIDIAKMSGNMKGQFEFCNSMDLALDNSVQLLEIKNNYTSLFFVTPKDFAADYEIAANNAKVTSKYIPLTEENAASLRNGNNYLSNHKYAGSFGKGGGTKINIRSNFGSVRFM